MSDAVELWETPQAKEMYMIVGWRQWADAGSISSNLPRYLVKQTNAEQIGEIRPDGFYLFQIPGTHDLVRPVVKFNEGFPESLDAPRNDIFYSGDENKGIVFFSGDEPHLNAERYVEAILHVAQVLKVKRIVGFGGVYGELPYDKERMISAIYSMPSLKKELRSLAVSLSDYSGGSSIGSYVCRRAAEREQEFVSFYAFVPTYDFSQIEEIGNTIRLENDHMAWLGVMRRVNHMLGLNFDLVDLEGKRDRLMRLVDAKVDELDRTAPQLGVREYMEKLSAQFDETIFSPLDEGTEDELRRLLDDLDLGDL